jgi:hypothetical protein
MTVAKSQSKAQKTYGAGAVRYTLPQGLGGPIQLNIDFGLAPPPDTYYYASAVSLKHNQSLGMATLSFGRPEVRGTAGNAVSVVLPEAVIFSQFWNSSRPLEQTLDQQLSGRKSSAVEIPEEKTGIVQTLYANSIFVSVGLGESCLDFYYLPPRDLHLARTRGAGITLYPVVRITLSQPTLKRLFEVCRPHAMPADGGELKVEASAAMERKRKLAKSR